MSVAWQLKDKELKYLFTLSFYFVSLLVHTGVMVAIWDKRSSHLADQTNKVHRLSDTVIFIGDGSEW